MIKVVQIHGQKITLTKIKYYQNELWVTNPDQMLMYLAEREKVRKQHTKVWARRQRAMPFTNMSWE